MTLDRALHLADRLLEVLESGARTEDEMYPSELACIELAAALGFTQRKGMGIGHGPDRMEASGRIQALLDRQGG